MSETSVTVTAKVSAQRLSDDESKQLERLLGKAQAGDKKALDEIRPLISKAGMWDFLGDLGRRVQDSWLEAMTGRNKLMRESYERRAETMRRELLAAGDSQLERLLVERVILTWIQVCHADSTYSAMLKGDGYTYRDGTFQQERQDRANARHLKAVKALASVRRLLSPSIQVNIGRNQIISQGARADAQASESA